MAYSGFLLKIGNYQVPHSLIKADSYKPYDNMQDYEPWTDADGYEHRDAVELKAVKIEFQTIPMNNAQLQAFLTNIRANITDTKSRGCNITAYIPLQDTYVTQYGYLAGIKPQIYFADANDIMYDPIDIVFVGGVATP